MSAPPGRLLKLKDVVRETSLSQSTIYRWMHEGEFPHPIRLRGRRVAWTERDLEAWKIRAVSEAPS